MCMLDGVENLVQLTFYSRGNGADLVLQPGLLDLLKGGVHKRFHLTLDHRCHAELCNH